MDRGDMDMEKRNELHDMNEEHGTTCGSGGGDGDGKNDAADVDTDNRANEMTTKPIQEERQFPRIQIKSPSKLAQEFNEKQKQSDAAAANVASASATSINENRTNNNKSSIDLNTTPLYDEPAEDRSYSLKEAPSSHSFASENHETPLSNTDTVSTAAMVVATAAAAVTAAPAAAAAAAVTTNTTESSDNCEH